MKSEPDWNNYSWIYKQKAIVNKKTCHRLDSYYKSSTSKKSTDFTITGPSPSKNDRISNDKLTPQKQLNKSLPLSYQEISVN